MAVLCICLLQLSEALGMHFACLEMLCAVTGSTLLCVLDPSQDQ